MPRRPPSSMAHWSTARRSSSTAVAALTSRRGSPARPTARVDRRRQHLEESLLSVAWSAAALLTERIEMIRRGIPSSEARRILADLAIGHSAVLRALKLPTAAAGKNIPCRLPRASGSSASSRLSANWRR